MKKLLCLLCLSGAAAMAQSDRDDFNGFFAQAHALYADLGDIKSTAGGSLILGYRFAENHSIDLDVSRFNSEQFTFTPAFLGYKYYLPLGQNWNGYIGAGAGIFYESSGYWWYHGTDNTAAVAFDIGASYNLSKRWALNFNAKSIGKSDSDLTTKGNIGLIRVGLELR